MGLIGDALEPNNLRVMFEVLHKGRDLWEDLRDDAAFARTALRKLTPLSRFESPPGVPDPIFPPKRPLHVPSLQGKRIALLASGGSGATAALCGIKRALEEADLDVCAISACSGAVLWGSLWAQGMDAETMGRSWLSLRTSDYLDPGWGGLARAPLRMFRRWGGMIRGEAIERTYQRWLGPDTRIGATRIPLWAVVWNIDLNRVEFLGTHTSPELPLARAVRCAISIPIFVEPVRIGGHWYGDGGIVDILPARPLLDDLDSYDLVIATNSYLPEGFLGQDIGDWYDRRLAILRASGQLRYAIYLELAREHVRQMGAKLRLLEPVPHEEVRGAHFYQSFLDRTSWPKYMRWGLEAARAMLEAEARPEAGFRPPPPGS
ncbi:MAG: patatin-like phospholipase family protein [Myxococcota bacterium]